MSEKARKTEELLEQMERERQVSYTLLCATKAAPNTISNYSTNTCHSIWPKPEPNNGRRHLSSVAHDTYDDLM